MLKDVKSAGIIGIGLYMPENIRPNSYWDDIELLNLPINKTKEDCFEYIKERRVFPPHMLSSDAETEAGRRALKDAGLSPDDVDLVLVHSMVPDELIPNNASLVQHKLGLKNAGAWNIDTCCSSFVTMVITASNLIAMGTFKKILIITSIYHSKIIDVQDYLAVPCGDGASAVVMGEVTDGKGYISSHCTSNGYYHDAFTLRERLPLGVTHRAHHELSPIRPLMTTHPTKVREMGRKSIEEMTPVMFKALEKADLNPFSVDFFLSHQPIQWANIAWRKSLGIPEGNSLQTFDIYGNIASTSIPASMYHALKENRIKDNDIVLIASSGAGENHAAAVLRWGK